MGIRVEAVINKREALRMGMPTRFNQGAWGLGTRNYGWGVWDGTGDACVREAWCATEAEANLLKLKWETETGVWIIVEMVTHVDYGEEGAYEYKQIGEEVYGPFTSEADAEAYAKKLNTDRPSYYDTFRKSMRKCDLRDFEVRELTKPVTT